MYIWRVSWLCLAWLADTWPGVWLFLVRAFFTFGLAGLQSARVLRIFCLASAGFHLPDVFLKFR